MNRTREQELEAVLLRLLTGLHTADIRDCEWYDGIIDDAESEGRQLLGLPPPEAA